MQKITKTDFTKEIKTAYRNSLTSGGDSLLISLVLEIAASNRGKLFLLRDKTGIPIYSYYISPSVFEYGDIKDSEHIARTIQLGIPETGVARSVANKIQEYGLANISACVVIENLARASFEYLTPFVEALYENWDADFQQAIMDKLREVLYGNARLEDALSLIVTHMNTQYEQIVQLYRELYHEPLIATDINPDVIENLAKAIIWFIEHHYGAEF